MRLFVAKFSLPELEQPSPNRWRNIVAPQIRISEMAAVRTTERIASPTLYPRYRRPTADHKTEICVWRTTIENARLASS